MASTLLQYTVFICLSTHILKINEEKEPGFPGSVSSVTRCSARRHTPLVPCRTARTARRRANIPESMTTNRNLARGPIRDRYAFPGTPQMIRRTRALHCRKGSNRWGESAWLACLVSRAVWFGLRRPACSSGQLLCSLAAAVLSRSDGRVRTAYRLD